AEPTPARKPRRRATKKATPTPSPAPAPASNDRTTPPVPASDNSLVEPMVRPGETPPPAPVQPEGTPATTINQGGAPESTPAPATAPAAENLPPAEPPAPKAPTIRELERAFDALRKQPADEAEYQAMMGEFEKLQAAESTPGSRLYRQIQGRIDWLSMKLEILQRQREIEDMKRRADSESREVTTKLAELERQRQYAIVGRLLPSTVYDGQNLPLMYRLQSVTGSLVPRTIGYIRPTDELELPSKLNMVVGVIGDMKLDPAASLNIINALRVDILQAADGGPVRNPEPAPTPAATEAGK
ncbi:MAG TPA: hypothetical protein VK176_04640, partial [Phycisphaerales bacterium]|nr:hypothetical protein [Phycisphaerales bacterium]